jgi:predicted transcriptional regulator
METVELKTEIHELIEKVNDTQLLHAIKVLLSKGVNSDWWEELSEDEKLALERGMQESEAGDLIAHNVAMEEIKEKYLRKK